jgi:hypothetical protein
VIASESEPGPYFSRISGALVPLLFLSFLVFYSLAFVGNRTEADDAYWFA